MRTKTIALMLSLLASLAACSKKTDAPAASDDEDDSKTASSAPADSYPDDKLVIEQHGKTTVGLHVTPSGDVYAAVKQDGKPVSPDDVEGKVTARALDGKAEPIARTLAPRKDALRADIDRLEAPITELHYALKVKDEPVEGVLFVPKAGTEELIDEGNVARKSKIKMGTKGPHGGAVQVVDDRVIEIVGKKGGGEVRVYYLDDDLKPVKIEAKEKVKLAFYAGHSAFVELEPGDEDAYFVGKVDLVSDPTEVTVVIEDGPHVHVALCGYEPGHVVVVGPHAPVVGIYVVDRWDVVVVEPGIVIHEGKGKWKHGGHGHGHVNIHIH
jgi:hypothetical protein